MIKVNGEFHELVEHCRVLPSGSPQICDEENATNLITEDGKLFPLNVEICAVNISEVADMFTALSILGVEE